MPRPVDMTTVWTVWELRDSMFALEYIERYADPLGYQMPGQSIEIPAPLTPWEIRDNDAVACELIRHYSERLN